MQVPQTIRRLTERVETLTIVVILIVAGALWAFVGLVDEMIEGDLHAFDEAILMALRVPGDPSDAIGGPQVETAMRDLTALGGITVLMLLTLSVLAYLLLRGKRASALFLAVAIVGGQLLSHGFKTLFSRPRPDLVPHGVDVATASFPSGHSMMAAVTYLTLAVMLARLDGHTKVRVFFVSLAAILALAVGVSRVYLGVHWPSDVLAGWTLGAAWALLVWLIARWLERRGRIDRETGG
ncbi:phosphatase PAP2 family protein [uncultured Maritimibacter sp.]|uniref:phosphatase PAP2 family protein n=1 Tax=uncultured Maritimibacter sp. TaxID=991866 RepID=UPI002597FC09|nr:phosphatase PAP2 family protein [uncultured Maritimibacter sp.]